MTPLCMHCTNPVSRDVLSLLKWGPLQSFEPPKPMFLLSSLCPHCDGWVIWSGVGIKWTKSSHTYGSGLILLIVCGSKVQRRARCKRRGTFGALVTLPWLQKWRILAHYRSWRRSWICALAVWETMHVSMLIPVLPWHPTSPSSKSHAQGHPHILLPTYPSPRPELHSFFIPILLTFTLIFLSLHHVPSQTRFLHSSNPLPSSILTHAWHHHSSHSPNLRPSTHHATNCHPRSGYADVCTSHHGSGVFWTLPRLPSWCPFPSTHGCSEPPSHLSAIPTSPVPSTSAPKVASGTPKRPRLLLLLSPPSNLLSYSSIIQTATTVVPKSPPAPSTVG